jgi:hypothetical protein
MTKNFDTAYNVTIAHLVAIIMQSASLYVQ